jgi:hypothetical protein
MLLTTALAGANDPVLERPEFVDVRNRLRGE